MSLPKSYAKILLKAFKDPKFKEELLKNPEAVFAQNGIEVPKGKKIEIHENTDKVLHFVMPAIPKNLSDKELEQLAAADNRGVGAILQGMGWKDPFADTN